MPNSFSAASSSPSSSAVLRWQEDVALSLPSCPPRTSAACPSPATSISHAPASRQWTTRSSEYLDDPYPITKRTTTVIKRTYYPTPAISSSSSPSHQQSPNTTADSSIPATAVIGTLGALAGGTAAYALFQSSPGPGAKASAAREVESPIVMIDREASTGDYHRYPARPPSSVFSTQSGTTRAWEGAPEVAGQRQRKQQRYLTAPSQHAAPAPTHGSNRSSTSTRLQTRDHITTPTTEQSGVSVQEVVSTLIPAVGPVLRLLDGISPQLAPTSEEQDALAYGEGAVSERQRSGGISTAKSSTSTRRTMVTALQTQSPSNHEQPRVRNGNRAPSVPSTIVPSDSISHASLGRSRRSRSSPHEDVASEASSASTIKPYPGESGRKAESSATRVRVSREQGRDTRRVMSEANGGSRRRSGKGQSGTEGTGGSRTASRSASVASPLRAVVLARGR